MYFLDEVELAINMKSNQNSITYPLKPPFFLEAAKLPPADALSVVAFESGRQKEKKWNTRIKKKGRTSTENCPYEINFISAAIVVTHFSSPQNTAVSLNVETSLTIPEFFRKTSLYNHEKTSRTVRSSLFITRRRKSLFSFVFRVNNNFSSK